jgi:hypothetical protein
MPFCEVRKRKKYLDYCFRCFVFLNPDSPLIRNCKTKELAVKEFILHAFPGLTWVHDKKIADGCSLRRPDLSLDLGSHVLFIEIDENGHDFGYSCESKRVCELWQDVGQRSAAFLRFNPDKYINDQDQKVTSCWKYDSKGFTVLKDPVEWTNRLQELAKWISYYINNCPEKLIEIQELFFNTCQPELRKQIFIQSEDIPTQNKIIQQIPKRQPYH